MTTATSPSSGGFRHEAMFYQGLDEFVAGTTAFLRDGIAAAEPILVVVGAAKIAALREALGQDCAHVQFADMAEVGANPARIIPAWQQFTGRHLRPGQTVRGIGEPIYPERSPAELVECQGHEALLNAAFDGGLGWRLLCPYDVVALPEDVIDEAKRSHPILAAGGHYTSSDSYLADHPSPARWNQPLPRPPHDAHTHNVGQGGHTVAEVRALVRHYSGLDGLQLGKLLTAVSEIVTNALVHGGGSAVVKLWHDNDIFVCDVHDRGRLNASPLLGRQEPTSTQPSGRGMWLAHQLCDLVQIRTSSAGTTVRLHLKNGR